MAAASYVWENMSFYDNTFRQMMAVNPQRSWSKIFTQIWNLAMHEPIMRNQNFSNGRSVSAPSGNFNNNSREGNGHNKKKRCSDACWRFNRNETCNAGCNFEHKCSYCGSYLHSVLDCPKLKGKRGTNRINNSNPHQKVTTTTITRMGNQRMTAKDSRTAINGAAWLPNKLINKVMDLIVHLLSYHFKYLHVSKYVVLQMRK